MEVEGITREVTLKGFQRNTKLHRVEILFNTPTFDKIKMDERANFVVKMSSFGGTMGLLTGFSLISGVEIIYFVVKFALNVMKRNFK